MEEREEIITLLDEDGEKSEFIVLDYFKVGELDYAILLPYDAEEPIRLDDIDEEEPDEEDPEAEIDGGAVIFRVIKGNNGATMLHVIEDDDEWERVAEIAYERFFSEEGDPFDAGEEME